VEDYIQEDLNLLTMDFSLTGKSLHMYPAPGYPILKNNLITLNGNESRGSGRKIRTWPLQQTIYDTPAKETDNPICDEKQVTKVTIPELPLVDVKNARFPYCLVWTPLPVIAWLVPFVGHVGICREDGIILDYGITSNVNINRLEFGSTAKYVRLHPYQVICYYYYYFLFLLFLFLLHRLNKNVLAVATYTILNISL
jgi:hypothetical protein